MALVAACHDGGGGGGGGGGPGGPPQLIVDFSLRTDVRLGTAFLGDLVHVDLDQDGTEDLVESNFGTKFLTIALGAIDGTFVTIHQLPTVGHAFQIATGDMDGDGLLDIAVASGDWVDGADRAVQVFLQGPLPGDFGAALTLDLATDPKGLTDVLNLFQQVPDNQAILKLYEHVARNEILAGNERAQKIVERLGNRVEQRHVYRTVAQGGFAVGTRDSGSGARLHTSDCRLLGAARVSSILLQVVCSH